jgi:hypothetical protein
VIFGGSEELPLVWRISHFLVEKENLWHFFLENDHFTYRGGAMFFFLIYCQKMQKINSLTLHFPMRNLDKFEKKNTDFSCEKN